MSTQLLQKPHKITSKLSAYDIVRNFNPRPTSFSELLTNENGNVYWAKDETDNPTGAYKWRGSAVKLTKILERNEDTSFVTASAGNHGQGVAWVAGRLGCRADVFVPTGTPQSKLDGLERLGANIHLVGSNFDESTGLAQRYAAKHSTSFVHPFDDIEVMSGQGTIADELVSQFSVGAFDLTKTTLFVPVGGGGLLGGVSERLRLLTAGRVKIVGVQVTGSDSAAQSFATALACKVQKSQFGYRIYSPAYSPYRQVKSIAASAPNNDVDGTRVSVVGANCLPKIVENVDEFMVVEPASLGKYYVQNPSSNLEPAGALATAGAHLYATLANVSNTNMVVLQTGRNQDPRRIANLVAAYKK